MALNDLTAQQLTPDERRNYLRAFADRMLIKVTAMDDPEDMPGVERAVRVAAVIERLYSRCDRSEGQAPDPRKLEAERANSAVEAIKARVALADTYRWGESRQQDLKPWWNVAQTMVPTDAQALAPSHMQVPVPVELPVAVQTAPENAPQDMAATDAAAPKDAAGPEPSEPVSGLTPETGPALSQASLKADYATFIENIRKARARLRLPDIPEEELAGLAKLQQKPPP